MHWILNHLPFKKFHSPKAMRIWQEDIKEHCCKKSGIAQTFVVKTSKQILRAFLSGRCVLQKSFNIMTKNPASSSPR